MFAGCQKNEPTNINLGDGSNAGTDDNEEIIIGDPTLYGYVLDNMGNPVEGVLVTDGQQTVLTGKDGKYNMVSDLTKRRFVYLTIPADYEVPSKAGVPQFFTKIDQSKKKFEANFILKKRTTSPDRYTILMSADPQIRQSTQGSDKLLYHSGDIYTAMCADMKDMAASITDRPVYGICLGDMVHDNMNLWPQYLNGLKDFTFPVFHAIGNHDHIQTVATDYEAISTYENYLGPTNFAVDLGKIHYLFIDNIVMADNTKSGDSRNGISNENLEWLKGHLQHVPKDRILMVSTHSSLYEKLGYHPYNSDLNAASYTPLFGQYKYVHTWAGHQHDYYNYAFAAEKDPKFQNVESHVLGRTTGSLGSNAEITSDGAWRGYLVIDVDGEDITWKFHALTYDHQLKPVAAYPAEGQFRATVPNENGWTSDGKVYVNIWMYDAHWGPVYYTDSGKSKVEMTRIKGKDGWATYLYNKYIKDYSPTSLTTTPNLFSIVPSTGAKSATVEVTDRFGKTWSTTLSW